MLRLQVSLFGVVKLSPFRLDARITRRVRSQMALHLKRLCSNQLAWFWTQTLRRWMSQMALRMSLLESAVVDSNWTCCLSCAVPQYKAKVSDATDDAAPVTMQGRNARRTQRGRQRLVEPRCALCQN